MYNRNYSSPTSLGLDERIERVLCYALLWVSGLIMLFLEQRNETVRRHAKQSVLVFGILGIVGWVAGLFGGLLGQIPVIGPLFGGTFGLVGWVAGTLTFVLWIGLMILAWVSPNTLFVGPRRNRYL